MKTTGTKAEILKYLIGEFASPSKPENPKRGDRWQIDTAALSFQTQLANSNRTSAIIFYDECVADEGNLSVVTRPISVTITE